MTTSDGDAEAARRYDGYQRVKEARNQNVPPHRLRELATDPVRPVRLAVARHPAAPPDALAALLNDEDEEVVATALLNRAVPTEALAAHAQAAPQSEMDVVAHHPNAPRHLRGRCSCPEFCFGAAAFRHPLLTLLREAVRRRRR